MAPMPASPQWLQPYLKQALNAAFPKEGEECVGFVDAVNRRYGSPPAGLELVGWAWSKTRKHTYKHFITVDPTGTIVGGGEGGIARADVPAAMPEVKNPNVGFSVFTTQTAGTAHVYGIDDVSLAACPIGNGIAIVNPVPPK